MSEIIIDFDPNGSWRPRIKSSSNMGLFGGFIGMEADEAIGESECIWELLELSFQNQHSLDITGRSSEPPNKTALDLILGKLSAVMPSHRWREMIE